MSHCFLRSENIIGSRGIWTNNSDIPDDFIPKCRIVGQGFQEHYDEKLRRDSPTCTPFMQNTVCSISASEKLELTIADVTGAFLQGKKIDRDLYFRLPTNLGRCRLKGVAPGSLLKLGKSICGTNDAARAWYLAVMEIFQKQGWSKPSFEPATFDLFDEDV